MDKPEQPEWVTLGYAATLDDVPVSGESLRRMIKRGDVPDGHWKTEPFGTRHLYYIDKAILPFLKYRYSGQRGKSQL